MIKLLILILVMVIVSQQASAKPIENEYGIANAWYNGQEATVKNVKLKIGEPVEIKVNVTSKINGDVYLKLTNPLVTEPYQVISGPSVIGKTIPNEGVSAGWSRTFTWNIAPNGAWKNGTAPINFFVQIFKSASDSKKIEFTIANPYILDEQYTGSTPSPKQTPKTTASAVVPASSPKSTPFPSAIFALAMLLLVRLWRRG